MDENLNDPAPPEKPGDEELPLIPLSPALNRSQRARALSQVSLQSVGGTVLVGAVYGGTDTGGLSADENGEHPGKLHRVSLTGDETEVKNMINNGAVDVNVLDKSGRTALHNAIMARHVNIVELLLGVGADTSILDWSLDPPLHTAVRTGNENLVKALLRHEDCDANITGNGSQTALHIAAEMDKVSICKILMEKDASPDCCDDEKMTPLTRAVEKGACSAAEFFFEDAKARQKDMMKDVLSNVDSQGCTLLHLAVDSGSLATVELCLNNGAIIRQPVEHDRRTAFHLACDIGALKIVELFKSKHPKICEITLIDTQGLTPLHLAALNNHPDVVHYLLEQGATVDPRDKHCRTPLFLAAERGGTESVKLLMDKGADVTVKDVDLRSCVRVAVGHTATMEMLLKKHRALSLITDKDITGFAPVHYAAMKGHLQDILLFMKRNKAAAVVVSDALGTALHVAARYGWIEIVDALLSGRNVLSINVKNSKGKTALHFACAEGHDRVVEHLLKLGATVKSDHDDRTALHDAAMRGSKRCVDYMLQHQPQCINHFDKERNTALHLAAIHGHPDVVSCLLSCDDQKIFRNGMNQNALDAAMEAGMKSSLLTIASHKRWREVLMSSAPDHMAQMKALVKKFPEVAVQFMDQCMTKKGNSDGKDYSIKYDFSLIQGAITPGQDYLMVLKTMLEHRRINCLTHPVCFIIMSTKWKTFGWKTLTLNLFLYLCFLIPLTALAVTARTNEKQLCGINETLKRKDYIDDDVPCRRSDKVIQALQYLNIIITIIHLVKTLLQFQAQGKKHLRHLSNYSEWTGYCFAMSYVLPVCDCNLGIKPQLGSIALLFGWMNLLLFIRRLSTYGQYIIMLSKMFITLLKILLLFFLFVMAFSTTFYLLMDEIKEQSDTFPNSMMTIFVMTLGEFNYADLYLPWSKLEYATLANIIFVLFLLVMPIILMNMLVGLAVGDIGEIQVNAAIDRYVMQVELVLDIEETIPPWLAKRAHVANHFEYPNRDTSNVFDKVFNKLYDRIFGFSAPGDDKEEDETSRDLPPEFQPLLKRINGIYDLLKEQSSPLKSRDQARMRTLLPTRVHNSPQVLSLTL